MTMSPEFDSLTGAAVGFALVVVAAQYLLRIFDSRPGKSIKAAPLVRAPGWTLLIWAEALLSPKFYERVVKPQIADMQWEYIEALKEAEKARKDADDKRLWFVLLRARMTKFWGYLGLFIAVWQYGIGSFVKGLARLWKPL